MEYGATPEHLVGLDSVRYVELFDRHDERSSSSGKQDVGMHSKVRKSRIRYKYARVSMRIVRPGSCVLIRLKAHLKPGVGLVNELFEQDGEAMMNITWLYPQDELPRGHDKTVPAGAAQAMLFEKPTSCASMAGQGARQDRQLYLTNHKQDLEAKSIMQPCVVYFLDRQPGEPCVLATFQDGKRVFRPRPGFICRCFFDVIKSQLLSLDEARSLLTAADTKDVSDAMRGTQEFMAGHSPPICLSVPQVPPRPMTKSERNQDIVRHLKNMSKLLDDANSISNVIDETWVSSFDSSLQRLAASIAAMTHERTVLDMRAMQSAKRTAATLKEKKHRHKEWQDRAQELVGELPSLSNDARELLGSMAQRLHPGTLPYRKAREAGITRVMAAWLWQIRDAPNPQQLQELKNKRYNALLELLGAMRRITPTKDDLQWFIDVGFGVAVLNHMGKRDWYEAEIGSDESAEAKSQKVQADVYRTKKKYMEAANPGQQSQQGDDDGPAPGPSAQQAHGTALEVPPRELPQASTSESRPPAQAAARPLPPAPARAAAVQRPPAPHPKRPEPPKPPEPPKSILVKQAESKVGRDKASTSTRQRRIRFADEAGGSLFTPGVSEAYAAKLEKAREDEFRLNSKVVYATVSQRIVPSHQDPPASGPSSSGQGTGDMDEGKRRRKAAEARGMAAWEGNRNRSGKSAASSRLGSQSDKETPSGSTTKSNGNQGLSTIAGPPASTEFEEGPDTPEDAGIAIADGQASTSEHMVADCGPERNGKSPKQGCVAVSKKRKLSASAHLDLARSSSTLDGLGHRPRAESRLEVNQGESRAAKFERGDEEAGNSLSALHPRHAGYGDGEPGTDLTRQGNSGSIAEIPDTSLASADVPKTAATQSAAAGAGGADSEGAGGDDGENNDDDLPLATVTERNSTVGGGTRIIVELRFGKRTATAEYDVKDKMILADDDKRMTLQQWFASSSRVQNPTFKQASDHVHVISLGIEKTLALYLDEACMVCSSVLDERNMIICDGCEHCWHTYCHDPEVKVVPEGKWFCNKCLEQLQALSHEELLRLI